MHSVFFYIKGLIVVENNVTALFDIRQAIPNIQTNITGGNTQTNTVNEQNVFTRNYTYKTYTLKIIKMKAKMYPKIATMNMFF